MSGMYGRPRMWAAAAAIHLAIAALYAPHIPAEHFLPRWIDRPLAIYGGFSGVHTHFDFFAPTVSTQARVEFHLTGGDGSIRHVRLATPSGEVNNRIALMLTHYAYPSEREKLLRAWGEFMLRIHPQVVAVETRIEVLEIPALREVAAGKASPRWTEIGRAVVRSGGIPGS